MDVRRYLAALRRSRGMIAATIVLITGGVLGLSLVMTETYKATSTIVLEVETGAFGTVDVAAVERRLSTISALLTSSDVVEEASKEVPGEDPGSIESAITSSVDPDANLIDITGSSHEPEGAAAIANAVAESFIRVQSGLERSRLEAAIEDVRADIAESADDPAAVRALQARLSELTVAAATAGADLQIAERAVPPGNPSSPRPLRNAVLAFFASIFLAVLLALGREQLRPRLNDPRELSQILGVPVLAGIPTVRSRLGRRDHVGLAVEHEAYETLRATIQLGSEPGGGQVILVTSAVHGEGKTTVTARLGQALARAGMRTLLVSADLRWPALHDAFDLPMEPGLSEILRLAERAGVSEHLLPATAHAVGGRDDEPAMLDVLTSGRKPSDPARLLSSPAASAFFEYVRTFEYDYILVDGPPMLGIADAQALAQNVDRLLLVSRLDRLSADHVIDVRELVERLNMRTLGVVVIGARVEVSPYYLSGRPGLFSGSEASREPAERPRA